MNTGSLLYPNLYVFLVGHAGIGKSRTIITSASLLREIKDLHIAPTSMTMASMVDALVESKRTIVQLPEPMIEYNSMLICADELSAFMSEWKSSNDLIAGLTTFYDVVPYSQSRRVKDIRIKLMRPQLNIISGTTPSNLVHFIPEYAWEQGFTSRIILVYSSDRPLIDVFNTPKPDWPDDMIHDLNVINSLVGEFGWTEEFARAMHNWKTLGQPPVPQHPKLEHYNSRRFGHLLKLSMIASVDCSSDLMLKVGDFNRAMGWLLEVEQAMPEIFTAGSTSIDSKAMDEILHFIRISGEKGMNEHRIVNFARERVPAHSVIRVIELMERSGLIKVLGVDQKTQLKWYAAI